MDILLSSEEKSLLLAIARKTIAQKLGIGSKEKLTVDEAVHSILKEKSGAFVTLKTNGNLRGCIGNIVGTTTLSESISDLAISSAFHDPRFPPMNINEYKDMTIEISLLSPLEIIYDPKRIKLGEHGIMITYQMHRGLLLPQVPVEQGWDLETFLDYGCRKAGLEHNFWRTGKAQIEIFTALVFSE